MKTRLQKRVKNEKGLTLVELLAVIVILGIIAAIAVPSIGKIIENSKYNAVKADAINVLNAANMYFVENPDATSVNVSATDIGLIETGFLESAGKIPTASTITKANPNTLTTTAITYSGTKTVTFDSATVDGINADTNKGSGNGGYTIGAAPTP